MLTAFVLPLVVTVHTNAPLQHNLQSVPASVDVFKWAAERRTEILASPRRGPGPDHGGDPNDETHDGGLPSNAHAGDGYPSDDPYNDTTSHNKNRPYKPY